jgi:hypothetical protein
LALQRKHSGTKKWNGKLLNVLAIDIFKACDSFDGYIAPGGTS